LQSLVYREGSALYSRDPVEVDDPGRDKLQERAHEREKELLEKFKSDPFSLTKMEKKRLKASEVCPSLRLLGIEMAKQEMTVDEIDYFHKQCKSHDGLTSGAKRLIMKALKRRSQSK
jgi:hypothetical protein